MDLGCWRRSCGMLISAGRNLRCCCLRRKCRPTSPSRWTGHRPLFASPPQAPCLPLKGSVRPQDGANALALPFPCVRPALRAIRPCLGHSRAIRLPWSSQAGTMRRAAALTCPWPRPRGRVAPQMRVSGAANAVWLVVGGVFVRERGRATRSSPVALDARKGRVGGEGVVHGHLASGRTNETTA